MFSRANAWVLSIFSLSLVAYFDLFPDWLFAGSGVPNSRSTGRSIGRPNMSSHGENPIVSCTAERYAIITIGRCSSQSRWFSATNLDNMDLHRLIKPLDHTIRLRMQGCCPSFLDPNNMHISRNTSVAAHQSGRQTPPLLPWPRLVLPG